MAIASSCPGSQSMMIGVGMRGVSCSSVAGVRDKLLSFALAFPGASLDHPWGEEVAKVNGKIFVFLGPAVPPSA